MSFTSWEIFDFELWTFENSVSAKPCGSCSKCNALKFSGWGAFFDFSFFFTAIVALRMSRMVFLFFLLIPA
jgi:hypothetical protein